MTGTTESAKSAVAGPLQRVVVGVDGSELSAAALAWVAERVPAGGSLHVVHALRPSSQLTMAAFQVNWTAARHDAERKLAGPWTEPARAAGHEPEVEVVDEEPARALLRVADRENASAVVMGVHGLGNRYLSQVGSVTRRLLHRSTRPVIVVNQDAPHRAPAGPGKVVAGVGYGEASDHALQWAAAYAAARGLHLELLHAVGLRPMVPLDSPAETLASYLGPGVELEWAAEDLMAVRDEVLDRYPELIATSRVEQGSAADFLVQAGTGAEVVVAGKRHSSRLARLTISPRLRQLIVGATCPTVIVPSCAEIPG